MKSIRCEWVWVGQSDDEDEVWVFPSKTSSSSWMLWLSLVMSSSYRSIDPWRYWSAMWGMDGGHWYSGNALFVPCRNSVLVMMLYHNVLSYW